ncbi:MAG: Mrp/NBP35 family ATP-binding protein [Planctomycetota bacterium]|nr:Mrp/NBP35 family ATP-binding protein [Planctomycetota bacterium]MDP6763198.1 Mrp/NBP35 family ATP-binding protein [Planctomycetota bacterium]MDP6990593.1 Mrp/NBP35 family ATP-binding protein [Planctomycetota bacterium]
MTQPTPDLVLDALRGVVDPDLNRDIVSLGFVTHHAVEDGRVSVTINLTTPACPVKDQMKEEAERLLRAIDGVEEVSIEMTAQVQGAPAARNIAPDIRHILAVSSGKGGVGKSTVTVNLACALAKTGARVGILDCDVYGPDIPMMMGLAGQPEQQEGKLVPKERHGVKTMSIGYLLDDEKPVIWRGPMIHKLIEQFLSDVDWGGLDYLLVDMPPGTGDAQLSLAQIVPLSGTVLVTTPQAVSTFDVGKAIGMFRQVNVEVLGIVENMSGLAVSGRVEDASGGRVVLHTGLRDVELDIAEDGAFSTVIEVFGTGGAELLANKHGFPMLGRVPLEPAVRVGGDGGDPVVVAAPDSAIARSFTEISGLVARRLAIREHAELPVLQ